MTSGDATRAMIARAPAPLHHIGAARDLDLFAGLDLRFAGPEEAASVVVTGLEEDERETPADYAGRLERLAARGLPMVCANPDIVVHRGERLIHCAGALGAEYVKLGGSVSLAGKPHPPIYAVARGELDPGEAADRIVLATRQYTRRQLTWTRRQLGAELLTPAGAEATLRSALERV